MNVLDWILLGIALFCVLRGLLRGAVSQLFGIAGVVGGFWVAAHYYLQLAVQLSRAFSGLSTTQTQVIGFLLLFLLTWFCLGAIGFWLARALRGSGLGFVDRFWGAVVGFGKAVILSAILISGLTFLASPHSPLLGKSLLVPHIHNIARLMVQATPQKVQKLFERKQLELKRYWRSPEGKIAKTDPAGSK